MEKEDSVLTREEGPRADVDVVANSLDSNSKKYMLWGHHAS
jgi:hypothetical protein